MASKKEPEVFNLLNLYQDDDDDDDMDDAEKNELQHEANNNGAGVDEREIEAERREEEEVRDANKVEDLSINDEVNVSVSVSSTFYSVTSTTTRFSAVSPPPKWSSMRPPTPQQAVADSDGSRQRREKPSIVDYAHDDVAMSPEHEDGEFLDTSAGRVMYGEELEGTRDFSQGTPIVNVMTSNNQIDSPQLLPAQVDVSQLDHGATKESEGEIGEGVNLSGENGIDVDPVQNFLPPPPEAKCSDELQDKINKFLAYKRQGKSFNVAVRNRKDYRNPDFLHHAVRYQDIDEIGSNFSKDVFDPHGYDKSDYFDEIEADMKREMERKEQERKRSPKVDFVSGGTQVGIAAAQKVTLPSPGISNRPSAGSQSSSSDMLTREGRQNKKSKWDKIDGDRRNVLGGGQETLSSVGAHAALLSAASAGAGYAAFTQQKRREADERRLSDKKADRRS